jgi:integrase
VASAVTVAILAFPAVRALPDTAPVSIVEVPAASAEARVSAPSAGQPAPASMTESPVLDPAEARALIDSINVSSHAGLRDRALIGLMVYSFARIGAALGMSIEAALGMSIEDVYTQNRRLWVRLREKGGKRHAMPCHQ